MKVPVPEEILPADRLGRVHFVGIGGAGLSAIARIMPARGIGSPAATAPTRRSSRPWGSSARAATSAMPRRSVADVDTLVVSTAVREDNPEVVEAQRPRTAGAAPVGRPAR